MVVDVGLLLALLPQFTDPSAAWPVAAQVAVLGLVHVGTSAVVYAGVGAGARRLLAPRPRAALVVSRVSGVALVTWGAVLLVTQLGRAVG